MHKRTYTRLLLIICAVAAQVSAAGAEKSSYAGEQSRDIKALSPGDVKQYLSGEGMGFAKAAELNNYPGPKHVLQLAEELHLSDAQRAQTQEIFQNMRQEASRLGALFIARERELDRLFASKEADRARLHSLMQEIALLQGAIRESHLRAHLLQQKILSDQQIAAYAHLRGYEGEGADVVEHDRHGH